ncbi:hypothetical protein BGZ61DRAFT_3999 [Ilyonectria robusta]|uniref:uncharacterized protein n=1 Tax=Ilyonectria robusta TaxID=1079257 RepID=UPI001E8DD83D|nr:uncharacterized protein BGZ61DRAFT_3999 [Ilyonectria robusta]KAH8736829.1 hypothetical protein BGZ61DRAFT_3999 [Ilyonectria robusta]
MVVGVPRPLASSFFCAQRLRDATPIKFARQDSRLSLRKLRHLRTDSNETPHLTNLKKSLGTVYIFAHVHVLLLGVTDDGFCPRKRVYMMGFMHCVLAGKTGNMGWVFFGMIRCSSAFLPRGWIDALASLGQADAQMSSPVPLGGCFFYDLRRCLHGFGISRGGGSIRKFASFAPA